MGFKAIVIGGSMAGLLTGRVLADHFEQVTIIEKDQYPTNPGEKRKGIPQAHHIHIVMQKGYLILEQLFPGLEQELEAQGAAKMSWGQDALLMPQARRLAKFASRPVATCTRTLLEWAVVQRVKALPNVTILQGQVKNLWLEGEQVKGVILNDEQKIPADFVVEATGRHTKAPEWLAQAGYETTPRTEIETGVGYASAVFELEKNYQPPWKAMILSPSSLEKPFGGGIYPIEHGQYHITCMAIGEKYHPSDNEDELRQFVQEKIQHPVFTEIVSHAQRVSPIYRYTRIVNSWNHYEKLNKFPGRFVVVGDAVCAFNPVYGQGMTVAAINAICLKEQLSTSATAFTEPDFGLKFQKLIAQKDGFAWQMATSDARHGLQKEPPLRSKILGWYKNVIFDVCQHNSEIAGMFYEVVQLVRPPSHLLHPKMMLSVAREVINPQKKKDLPKQNSLN